MFLLFSRVSFSANFVCDIDTTEFKDCKDLCGSSSDTYSKFVSWETVDKSDTVCVVKSLNVDNPANEEKIKVKVGSAGTLSLSGVKSVSETSSKITVNNIEIENSGKLVLTLLTNKILSLVSGQITSEVAIIGTSSNNISFTGVTAIDASKKNNLTIGKVTIMKGTTAPVIKVTASSTKSIEITGCETAGTDNQALGFTVLADDNYDLTFKTKANFPTITLDTSEVTKYRTINCLVTETVTMETLKVLFKVNNYNSLVLTGVKTAVETSGKIAVNTNIEIINSGFLSLTLDSTITTDLVLTESSFTSMVEMVVTSVRFVKFTGVTAVDASTTNELSIGNITISKSGSGNPKIEVTASSEKSITLNGNYDSVSGNQALPFTIKADGAYTLTFGTDPYFPLINIVSSDGSTARAITCAVKSPVTIDNLAVELTPSAQITFSFENVTELTTESAVIYNLNSIKINIAADDQLLVLPDSNLFTIEIPSGIKLTKTIKIQYSQSSIIKLKGAVADLTETDNAGKFKLQKQGSSTIKLKFDDIECSTITVEQFKALFVNHAEFTIAKVAQYCDVAEQCSSVCTTLQTMSTLTASTVFEDGDYLCLSDSKTFESLPNVKLNIQLTTTQNKYIQLNGVNKIVNDNTLIVNDLLSINAPKTTIDVSIANSKIVLKITAPATADDDYTLTLPSTEIPTGVEILGANSYKFTYTPCVLSVQDFSYEKVTGLKIGTSGALIITGISKIVKSPILTIDGIVTDGIYTAIEVTKSESKFGVKITGAPTGDNAATITIPADLNYSYISFGKANNEYTLVNNSKSVQINGFSISNLAQLTFKDIETTCPKGYYRTAGPPVICTLCDENEVSSGTAETCTLCVDPNIPSNDLSKCEYKCEDGQYINTETGVCADCLNGQYSNIASKDECDVKKVYILYKSDKPSDAADYEDSSKFKVMNEGKYDEFPASLDAESLVVIFIDTFDTAAGLSAEVAKFKKQDIEILESTTSASSGTLHSLEAKKFTFSKTSILTGKADSTTKFEGASSKGEVSVNKNYNKHLIASFDDVLTIKQEPGASITESIALAPQQEDAKIVLDESVDITKQKFTISKDSKAKTLTVAVGDKDISETDLASFIDTKGSSLTLTIEKSSQTSSKKGLSGGAIAGIVIACIVVVAGAIVAVILILKKKKKILPA